jgi:hypothetical protein
VDDWLRNLPGQLAYDAVGLALLYSARWAYQNRKRLIKRGKGIRVTVTDHAGTSDSYTQELTGGGIESQAAPGRGALVGMARGRSKASGVLQVSFPKKPSPAEEMFWWYLRLRLS